MAAVTLRSKPAHTVGELPELGTNAPDFGLAAPDLSEITLASFAGKRLILNIFPSIDTSTCATSVRRFNEEASALDNTAVLCVSADLPFALKRFCEAEGIDNVQTGSSFRSNFGQSYGVTLADTAFSGLLARAVVVVNESGSVVHTELVSEIANEPDYQSAIDALS